MLFQIFLAPPSAWGELGGVLFFLQLLNSFEKQGQLLADSCPVIPRDGTKDGANPNQVHVQNTGFQHDHSSYTFTIYRRFEQF